MNLEDLKEIIGVLNGTDITELQIEKDGLKVKIKRDRFSGHFETKRELVKEPSFVGDLVRHDDALMSKKDTFTVTSPIVGTFYRASSPDAEPFVEVGSRVRKGQVLCIIEAMKLMNEIESEVEGTVVRILVDNNQPVEYGEPLFIIDTSS
ncbi:MAG: acetyl-CoA carboxylase biotin carboxyl carrier protein [Thermodesulfovibrionales bacterium]|nr:acetyl-CoA carboxylase biotin carboxyl carrier protein [Thermodesulfovibrionales bacterium]